MARTARGAATIIDVQDGNNPITAYLTNENHTFAAGSDGTVSNVAGFASDLVVFVGDNLATYNVAGTTTPNTYRIANVEYQGTSTGWGGIAADGTGEITVVSISNTAVISVTAIVTFSVTNANGIEITGLTQQITFSIVKEGTGGAVIEMTATNQSFFSDNAGTLNAGQDDIIIEVETQGNVGDLSVQTSIDGAAFANQQATGDAPGDISAFDTDTSGTVATTGTIPATFARLAISSGNLGTSNTLTVRINGGTGGVDTISIFKVREGAEGNAAIIVTVESDNGTIFKNSAGANKVLTAFVFDAEDGSRITNNVSYHWTRSGSGSVSPGDVRVTSDTDRTVVPTSGVIANGPEYPTITLDAGDVTSNEQFTCEVVVSE